MKYPISGKNFKDLELNKFIVDFLIKQYIGI